MSLGFVFGNNLFFKYFSVFDAYHNLFLLSRRLRRTKCFPGQLDCRMAGKATTGCMRWGSKTMAPRGSTRMLCRLQRILKGSGRQRPTTETRGQEARPLCCGIVVCFVNFFFLLHFMNFGGDHWSVFGLVYLRNHVRFFLACNKLALRLNIFSINS